MDQLTPDDYQTLISSSDYGTPELQNVGKPYCMGGAACLPHLPRMEAEQEQVGKAEGKGGKKGKKVSWRTGRPAAATGGVRSRETDAYRFGTISPMLA